VIFVEPWPEHWRAAKKHWRQLTTELQQLADQHSHTSEIRDFLLLQSLPTDIRHNAKIFREKLADQATAAFRSRSNNRSS
jgi:hypothetical protein